MPPTIRPETPADFESIRRVHQQAFGQDEEAVLVDGLRAGGFARLSLVAEVDGAVVGHVLFSDLPILVEGAIVPSIALAPVAVLPAHQGRGIGSALIHAGLDAARAAGHRIAIVLGHPHYYPRFGFAAKMAEPLLSPFSGKDSWMALELVPGSLAGVTGWVQYPPPFGIGPFVRPVHSTDRDEWLRLRQALWPEETAAGHEAEIAAFLAGRPPGSSRLFLSSAVFVAVRPTGKLCGFLEASIRAFAEGCAADRVGYVEGWFVDPDCRRRGIGRQLLEAAEQWAANHGCPEMASDAELSNAQSRDVHLALGFAECGRSIQFRKPLPGRGEVVPVDDRPLRLLLLDGTYAVARLSPDSAIPEWAGHGSPVSVTRTGDELSVVCRAENVPEGVVCERHWRCFRVAGAMPFSLVGVLASLTAPLAAAGVGVFAISTFDTDYLFVKAEDLERAMAALTAAPGDPRRRLRPITIDRAGEEGPGPAHQ